ncbi:MAG: LmbU family transcriptional regulator [Verrucomicrobiales bacterium]|nr:LmbU family transcriptional regulator [Verrucomicrobiales bacterium]
MNALAINDPKFAISPTGIQFNDTLSFEEWDSLGQKLAPVGKAIGFIVGDWINYGEAAYGEKYKQALETTGIPYQTLANYAHVARKVGLSCRQENLGFEHHAVVAKLKSDEEKHYWLGMADKHNLSVRRLRKSINFGRLATDEEVQGDPADRGYVTYLALLNRIRRWWKRETEKAPVDQWDEDRRAGLKKDFALVVEIFNAL